MPDIFKVWDDEDWIAPVVEEQYKTDRTILTLTFTEKQAARTSDKKQAAKNKRKKQVEKTSRKNKRKNAF